MMGVTEWFGTQLVYALGWTLVHSLWQAALAAALLALLLSLIPDRKANGRYLISALALVSVLVMTIATFSHYFQLIGQTMAQAHAELTGAPVAATPAKNLSGLAQFQLWLTTQMPAIVLIWLAGFTLLFVRYCGAWAHCFSLKRHTDKQGADQWQLRVDALSERIGLKRVAELRLTDRVSCPCVIGHIKPILFFPVALLSRLTPEEVEALLLHELGHIRRNDYLVGLIEGLIKTLYFFNWPVLWICRQLDRERESACDDIAARHCRSRLLYARALNGVSAATFKGGLAMSTNGNQHHLLRRIRRLFEPTTNQGRSAEGLLSALSIALVGLWLSFQAHSVSATNTYPEIESLDDGSVHRLIETYKSQALAEDQNPRLTTQVQPGTEFRSLSDGERQAFVSYFQEELWEKHYENLEAGENHQHLASEEWTELKRIRMASEFGHVLNYLTHGEEPTETLDLDITPKGHTVQVRRFGTRRLEVELPLETVRSLYAGSEQMIRKGPLSLARQKDDRMVVFYRITEDADSALARESVSSSDSDLVFASINGDPTSDPGHISFHQNKSAYQFSLGKPVVNRLLAGESLHHGDAMAGVKTVGHATLELVYEREADKSLFDEQMSFSSSVFSPDLSDRKLHRKIQRLPSDWSSLLYNEKQLDRVVKFFSANQNRAPSKAQRDHYRMTAQDMRVDYLLEAMKDPDTDYRDLANGSMSMHNQTVWATIIPDASKEEETTFDWVVENQPLSQAVTEGQALCKDEQLPERYHSIDEPISIYGVELTCEQVPTILEQLAAAQS